MVAACVAGGVLIAYLMLTREGSAGSATQPVADPSGQATAGSAVHLLSHAAVPTLTADAGDREGRATDVRATAPIAAAPLAPSRDAAVSHQEMRMQRELPASAEAQPAAVTPAGPGLLASSDGVFVRQALGAGSEAALAPVAPAPAGDVTTDPVSGMTLRRTLPLAEGALNAAPTPAGGGLVTTRAGVVVRTELPAESPQ